MIVGSRRRERTGHSNCIEAIAQKLKPHQAFEIEWIDASESDVTSVLLPLPDHNVETRHQEIGWFVTLQKGASWRDLHLIYIIRILDADTPTKRYRVESIPLVLAKRIVPLDVKQALKAIKRASAAANTASARPRHHRRHTQRFNDGSVKHVD
jgi:hypothetical protein